MPADKREMSLQGIKNYVREAETSGGFARMMMRSRALTYALRLLDKQAAQIEKLKKEKRQ